MAAFKYEYSGNSGFYKVSAQVVGEICEELEKSEKGLSPSSLLDASRDESSPLHNEFEWDDTVAAEKWRLEQARLMISHIRIVKTNDQEEREAQRERAFVSTPGRKSVYASLDTAMHRKELRNYLLDQARRDSEIFLSKYRRMEQLAAVCREMENFLSASA